MKEKKFAIGKDRNTSMPCSNNSATAQLILMTFFQDTRKIKGLRTKIFDHYSERLISYTLKIDLHHPR